MKRIDKISLLGMIILFLIIAFTTFGCSSTSPATRYAREAEKREYPFWLKNQKFDKKDWRIQVAENQLEAYQLRKKRETEQEEIKAKVEAIKSKIK